MYRGRGIIRLSVYLPVTSISSHRFEAKQLRFITQVPRLNETKCTEGIFEILLGAELQGHWVLLCSLNAK